MGKCERCGRIVKATVPAADLLCDDCAEEMYDDHFEAPQPTEDMEELR